MTSVTFPAEIMLVCAMNPCPCGFYGDSRKECHCTPRQVQNYISRISGPLLDRIDIHVEVPNVPYTDLASATTGETSEVMRKRIENVRIIQLKRFRGGSCLNNSRMSTRMTKKFCNLDSRAEELLRQAMVELGISARGYGKILKIGRTIADLDDSGDICVEHISEAIQYRSLDRSFLR
jgi:magnesium chelatase family protein